MLVLFKIDRDYNSAINILKLVYKAKEVIGMTEDESVVYIGGKPFINYVNAVLIQLSKNGVNNVVVKSRGKFISKAVDVVEVVRQRFLQGKVDIHSIKTNSEECMNKENKNTRVSTIDIDLITV